MCVSFFYDGRVVSFFLSYADMPLTEGRPIAGVLSKIKRYVQVRETLSRCPKPPYYHGRVVVLEREKKA